MIDSIDDLTRPLVEADSKFGSFEPDPNDPLVMRYIPSDKELKRIETWLKEEIDQAWEDDRPRRQKKFALLEMFSAKGNLEKKIIELPLVKRAVEQKVAWVTNTIMNHKPIATVTPDSNDTAMVLIDDPQFGPMPIEKTSEESAQALELWLEYKLRKCLRFRRIVRDACLEAKRGQTPTYLKVCHYPQKRIMRAPRFEAQGPLAVTFTTKEDREAQYGEATTIENLSTYMALMPVDEQDLQTSRWFSEFTPKSNEAFRAMLYNGECFLIDKKEYEKLIEEGQENELRDVDRRKAANEGKLPGKPRPWHDIQLVWLFWTVPVKDTVQPADGPAKKATSNEEYSMVGFFHRKLGKLMSLKRNPNDAGFRPYKAVYDWKEPFRNDDESTAEYNSPYQRVFSDLISLEIKGGVIATTPIFYTEPGSMAGEWMADHIVEPGDAIPRMRKEEVEKDTLGERPQSLIGLAQFIHSQYERDNSLGDLQLGLNIPSRTPSSSIAQVLNQGETVEDEFLEDFRLDLSDVLKMYVQTVQQYMRFGEVIPFDPETRATVLAALQADQNPEDVPSQIPVRFPQEPINRQFAFDIAASSDDRSKQNDFDRLIALKQQIDGDGAKFAQLTAVIPQLIQATASGQVGPEMLQMLAQDFDRSEFMMEQLGKSMRRDGSKFAIDRRLMRTLVQNTLKKEQEAAQAAAQQGQASGVEPMGQGQPDAQQQPQGPPPPKISISLSGKLTPSQEAEAAQKQGIGGSGGMDAGTNPNAAGANVPTGSGNPQSPAG